MSQVTNTASGFYLSSELQLKNLPKHYFKATKKVNFVKSSKFLNRLVKKGLISVHTIGVEVDLVHHH